MREPLAAAFLALSVLIVLWNLLLAGRLARHTASPPFFALATALVGLLIVPAILIALATSSILFARAIQATAWVWPAVVLLTAIQATYAAVRRLTHPAVAVPIAVYDLLLAAVAITGFLVARGVSLPASLLALPAAEAGLLARLTTPSILVSPFFLYVPILAPAFRARWTASLIARAAMVLVAVGATMSLLAEVRFARRAVMSYEPLSETRFRERPEGDFSIGVRIFDHLERAPSPSMLRNDFAIADTLEADVIAIVLDPRAATRAILDSLRRSLEERRRGGAALIVALAHPSGAPALLRRRRALDEGAHIAAVDRVARQLRPEYILPVLDPFGSAALTYGILPPERWQRLLTDASATVRAVDRRMRVAVAVAPRTTRDSILFAWAAAADSPVGAVGFVLNATHRGGRGLQLAMDRAAGWAPAVAPARELWVFALRGAPVAHGEASQQHAAAGVLAWATTLPSMRGVILWDAADYETLTGLRAASGRVRPAAFEVRRAARLIRESAEADTTAAPPP